jgi:hypothetical protein
LAAILSLNIDEDDDGNKASYPQRVTNEMKEELIASLIDLEMDDSKRQLAYSSIQNCQEIGEFSKIKTRLQQFKPGPSQLKTYDGDDVEKEIKNLTTKLKTNV